MAEKPRRSLFTGETISKRTRKNHHRRIPALQTQASTSISSSSNPRTRGSKSAYQLLVMGLKNEQETYPISLNIHKLLKRITNIGHDGQESLHDFEGGARCPRKPAASCLSPLKSLHIPSEQRNLTSQHHLALFKALWILILRSLQSPQEFLVVEDVIGSPNVLLWNLEILAQGMRQGIEHLLCDKVCAAQHSSRTSDLPGTHSRYPTQPHAPFV